MSKPIVPLYCDEWQAEQSVLCNLRDLHLNKSRSDFEGWPIYSLGQYLQDIG